MDVNKGYYMDLRAKLVMEEKMNNINVNSRDIILKNLKYMYLLGSFVFTDLWLRGITRFISKYSVFAFAPNCFTLCWSLLIILGISAIKSRRVARIIYGISYYLSAVYSIVQYFSYIILGRFLYVSDFMYASEGEDYKSYVLGFIDKKIILYIFAFLLIGIIGIIILPTIDRQKGNKQFSKCRMVLLFATLVGIVFAPMTYEKTVTYNGITYSNNFAVPSFEYDKFINSTFDMELTGTYQFVARDIYLSVSKKFKSHDEEYEIISAYFYEIYGQ